MSQQPSSKRWIIILVCLVIAAVAVAAVASVTIGTSEPNPMQLSDPDYPGLITDLPVYNPIDRPFIDPNPPVCLYGCPNPTELSATNLTKETEVLDYE